MDGLEFQHLARMATQTIIISRLDACVGFMALVAVEPGHGDPVGEGSFRRLAVTREAPFPAGDEGLLLFWRKRVAPEAGDVLHANTVNFPVLVTAQARVVLRPEGMDLLAVTILAGKLFHEDVPGMASRLIHRQ